MTSSSPRSAFASMLPEVDIPRYLQVRAGSPRARCQEERYVAVVPFAGPAVRGGDFVGLSELIRQQAWDEATAQWRRKMRRRRVAFFLAYFVVSTACHLVIVSALG